jgi:PhoH-like ATPase
MKFVYDTNSLILYSHLLDLEGEKIIPEIVLHELDKLKVGITDTAYRARQAVRKLKSLDNIIYDHKFNKQHQSVLLGNNDDCIVECAKEHEACLITGDFLVQLKAKAQGIEVYETEGRYEDYGYKGFKEVILDHDELASFYENQMVNKYELLTNEYLLIKNLNNEVVDKFRWNGRTHAKLKHSPTKKIKSMNHLQDLAIDLLLNTDIPIKIIAGNYGSGKTILSVKSAIYHVMEKGNYAKIMAVRNPIGSGKDVGYLKGTKDEKTAGFFKPFIQHLEGGEQTAHYLEQQGVLTKEIPFYMKGLSIENTIIVCDEAEDLDVKLIRLIGTRLGKDSAVIFAGDYNQTEIEYKNNNGLMTAIDKLRGNPLVGIVVLEEDVRSDASKVFAELE